MKNLGSNQNSTGSLKLPQAFEFNLNQRTQFNSPRFNAMDNTSMNSPNFKANNMNTSKTTLKQNSSTQQLNSQQLQLSSLQQQQNQTKQQSQNSISNGSLSPKLFGFNQDNKRGFSGKKKDINISQQEQSANSISGYVQKFFQQQQQQNSTTNQNGNIFDIGNITKQQLRKSPIQAPYMVKKQGNNSIQSQDINMNQISPSSQTNGNTSPNNQNFSLTQKPVHRKSQSLANSSQAPTSASMYQQNYNYIPYSRSKDQQESGIEDKSSSKMITGTEKNFHSLSKNSSLSTNIPQLPVQIQGSQQNSPQNSQYEPIAKIGAVFQASSPYFNSLGLQQNNNNQQNQNQLYSSGLNQPESKSARTSPKNSLLLETNPSPKQSDLTHHPLSAKNSTSKQNIRQNFGTTETQTITRGNRSSSGHLSSNDKYQSQKGEILLQKKLEQINTDRFTAGKSYSFSQGQFQQALAQANNNSLTPNSQQVQQNNTKYNSKSKQTGFNFPNLQLQTLQQPSNPLQAVPQMKKSRVDNIRKKSSSQVEFDDNNNLVQRNLSQTDRQNRQPSKENISYGIIQSNQQTQNITTSILPIPKNQATPRNQTPKNQTIQRISTNPQNTTPLNGAVFNVGTNNGNYKDKIVKQQQQLSQLVSQQKQESSDFDVDIKDKNEEKETQSCESENSSINNNNLNTNQNNNLNFRNQSPSYSETNTPINKKTAVSKKSNDKSHPETPYYFHGLQKAFKTPNPMDAFSQLFRQHFLQTCQGILFSNIAKPLNPKDLTTKKVQLGPRKQKYKKTLIFDMDETLIHCNENINTPSDVIVNVRFPTGDLIKAGINVRPYAIEILQELSEEFEIVIFTASHNCYAQAVIDHLDPQKKYVHHRYFRDTCIQTPQGVYIKDLRVFTDRSLNEVVLIDNAAYSFSFQIDNGIPIIPFYDNKSDTELLHLLSYLRNLHHVTDVRAYNRQHLKMQLFKESEGPQKVYDNLFKRNS